MYTYIYTHTHISTAQELADTPSISDVSELGGASSPTTEYVLKYLQKGSMQFRLGS